MLDPWELPCGIGIPDTLCAATCVRPAASARRGQRGPCCSPFIQVGLFCTKDAHVGQRPEPVPPGADMALLWPGITSLLEE